MTEEPSQLRRHRRESTRAHARANPPPADQLPAPARAEGEVLRPRELAEAMSAWRDRVEDSAAAELLERHLRHSEEPSTGG